MGVQNLWQLLGPTARPTKLQALEGKRLAIDISIWLHQATKGVRNTRNGHVMVLYNRICKLLYFNVKPIFVFDGPNVPRLKARILQERQRRRNVAANKAKDLERKIQSNIIESYALQTVLGGASEDDQLRDKSLKYARRFLKQQDEPKDLFELPIQSNSAETGDDEQQADESEELASIELADGSNDSEPSRPISITNIEDMDQEVFDALPADIKIEILTNYKERLKSRKSHSFDQFPEKSQDFSQYQMKLLLKKNEITSKINSIKSAANTEYTADLPFENVFLSKVASEDDKELILLTRKETTVLRRSPILEEAEEESSSSDLISQLEREKDPLQFKTKLEQCLESNLIKQRQLEREKEMLAESQRTKRKNSDECVIEFDYNNRITLVNRYQDEGQDVREVEEMAPTRPNLFEEKSAKRRSLDTQKKEISRDVSNQPCTSASLEESAFESLITLGAMEDEVVTRKATPSTYCAELTSKMDINKDPSSSDSESDEDFEEVNDGEADILLKQSDLFERPQAKPTAETTPKPSTLTDLNLKLPEPSRKASLVQAPEAVDDDEMRAKRQEQVINDFKNYDLNELETYSENLMTETAAIARERKEQERLSNKIESQVTEDAKRLLQLFGLPYITSPGEAEAQCAYLDLTNQTDGSITEDSDVWLFGGRRVYKNFFSTDQFIDFYSDSAIQGQLGLDRESLICIAYLVGSDYSEGIEGVGIVKAVEILQEFEGKHLEKLQNFKKWHSSAGDAKNLSKFRAQLAKLDLPENFPNQLIYKAYMEPDLDKSEEAFEWHLPELDEIRKFLNDKLSWSAKRIDDGLLPVIKRMSEKKIQQPIEAFFSFEALNSAFNKQSKRMQSAITSLKQKSKSDVQEANKSKDDDIDLSEEENESFSDLMRTKSQNSVKTGPKVAVTPKRLKASKSSNTVTTKKSRKAQKSAQQAQPPTDSGLSEQEAGSKRKSPDPKPTSSHKLRRTAK